MKIKINLGAGRDIKDGYINHDIKLLRGIDVAHDLNSYPWPWDSQSVDLIEALDLLEHLDNFIQAMEEVHRILKPDGSLHLKVPYWNSVYRHIDPTHKRGFHEATFKFFDPNSDLCKLRPYYTFARFRILEQRFILIPFSPYLKLPFISKIVIRSKFLQRLVGFLGNTFSNIILDLELYLMKLPADNQSDL